MFTARQIVQDAFVTYPKLKDASPEEIAKTVSSTMEVQVKDMYNDGELSAKVSVDYIKSNLRGFYFCVVCDICAAKCRKAYVRKIVVGNIPVGKVLCGKCARIKYKRRTEADKRAIMYALNQEMAGQVLKTKNLNEGLVVLESVEIRKQLEDRAEQLTGKLTGKLSAEIIE